jgi:hypothetical protein
MKHVVAMWKDEFECVVRRLCSERRRMMNRRKGAPALLACSVLSIIAGILVLSSADDKPASSPSSATVMPTTTIPDEAPGAFLDLFVAGIQNGDADFLKGRLHPEAFVR